MAARALRDLPDWPRLLDADMLEAYTGMSEAHAVAHLGVEAQRFGRRKLYDRRLLDRALDERAGLTAPVGVGEDWTEAFG